MMTKPEEIKTWFKEWSWKLDFPEAYLGDEPNAFRRDWDKAEFRACFGSPNSYQVMIGNLGVPIMVRALGEARPNYIAERFFFCNTLRELTIFQTEGIPFFSIESKRPLKDFDLLGFSVTTHGMDVNVIHILRMSGMQVRAKDRAETDPIIIRGGADWSNPMPFADMYDVCFCGEGEEAIVQMADLIRLGRSKGWSKAKILYAMSLKIRGAFVPRFYQEVWKDGKLTGWKTFKDVPGVIKRAYLKNLDSAFLYDTPITNYMKSAMGSGELLISRGCPARCSFCNEGNINKPSHDRKGKGM